MLSVIISTAKIAITFGFISLTALWLWFQWRHRRYLKVAANIPCIFTALPLLGHAHYTIYGMEAVARFMMDTLSQSLSKGIYTITFWCGPYPIILCHALEDVQKLLNSSSTSEKSHEYDYFKFASKNGLINAPNKIWRVTRRHINPLFVTHNIEQLIPVFNKNSRELVLNLSKHVGHGPVELMTHTIDTALKTVCHLIFGADIEFDTSSESFRGLKTVIEKIPEILTKKGVQIWLRFDAVFQFFYKKELEEMNKLWKSFTDTPLKIAKSKNEHDLESDQEVDENMQQIMKGPTDLINVFSVLQKKYPQFSDEDLKSEMVTLYLTGSDTVGVTVASCLLILAQYQDVQERLYQDISQAVGAESDISLDDLDKMPYLDQVFRETLRWTTLVPYVLRRTTEDIQLSSCTIPAGYTVAIGLAGIHMDPKTFPNPKKFDPERFSAENMEKFERYSFLPFSGGPRNCIGKKYAEILVKIMIAHVLRQFKLSTTMDIYTMKRKYMIILVGTEGYNVTLENRV